MAGLMMLCIIDHSHGYGQIRCVMYTWYELGHIPKGAALYLDCMHHVIQHGIE